MTFFGRSEGWSEDDGWETIDAGSEAEAAQKFAEKWDLEDQDKFSVVAAAFWPPRSFEAKKAVITVQEVPREEDDGPDSQR